jgi:NAD(P)-dependent dehydrogenase (short-subunit alcohol dehydrogenase family)
MIMNSKQVALITGSSTGFGRIFTETLARKGHTVFATMWDLTGRDAKNASEIRALAEKDSLPNRSVGYTWSKARLSSVPADSASF